MTDGQMERKNDPQNGSRLHGTAECILYNVRIVTVVDME